MRAEDIKPGMWLRWGDTVSTINLKPCLPPKGAGADVKRLKATDVTIGGVDAAEFFAFSDLMDAQYKAHQSAQPKPCDCPRCTGPVATLLTMPCQGADWRQAEPHVYEVWVEPMTGRWVPADSRMVPFDGAERAYHASGHGRIRHHPIREEAIRLWREAVR